MIIGQIGTSLRTAGLEELDQVLDQLLTYEANEQSRRKAADHRGSFAQSSTPTVPTNALHELRTAILSPVVQSALRKRPGKQPECDFPDLATYNTILHIITGTVHRSKVTAAGSSKYEQKFDEDEADDDVVTKFAEQQLDSQAAQLEASLTSKLRRFHLDVDAAPLHLDAFERADRLFHTVLDRMQRKSRIEPDAVTFNIMITMYCLLDRWSEVHRVIRSANDTGALSIDSINNVLSHWLARGPTSKSRQRNGHDVPADAADSALEVYRQLRQNLVRVELASQDASIAYGRMQRDRPEHSADSQDQLGPLAWPDRNEAARSSRSQTSLDMHENGAVEAVLGLSGLPAHITPDEITHALMINSLTREGRFADALGVFKDLVSTPRRQSTAGSKTDRTRQRRNSSQDKQEKSMQATVPMFISFFRGFARYGRPSAAIDFDPNSPESTSWGPVSKPDAAFLDEGEVEEAPQPLQEEKHAQQLELWTIDTFQPIFDAFLGLEPEMQRAIPGSQTAQVLDARRELLDRRVSTPFGWLTSTEKRQLDAIRRGPVPKELFWILTAIRRVSNDHAEWSLAMWQKVVDKFSSESRPSPSHLGWTGFRLDSRLHRVLAHLQGNISRDEPADKLQEE
ncbi:Pentatricopeptide repeat [Kalmanozyma brasiliensis GHG001]|nr:Pentatricopeptide repeat [Kalmanozyma brasiliensis GHG001]EST08254.2 Pentatricopeptide repeat [Kalmanozyma brasiliensis GHG001]